MKDKELREAMYECGLLYEKDSAISSVFGDRLKHSMRDLERRSADADYVKYIAERLDMLMEYLDVEIVEQPSRKLAKKKAKK